KRKKKLQNLRNIKGRTVKRRDTDQQQRLMVFKESYRGKKEVPQRNKPWSALEWQNHWNSLDQRQQDNLDLEKSMQSDFERLEKEEDDEVWDNRKGKQKRRKDNQITRA
ncbi:Uncharacterized protein APZ42_001468, partial [Daphnia magna]